MQRRTFLESAAVAVGGLLTWRPPLKRAAKWTPPPQWEWEVSPWYLWQACHKGCSKDINGNAIINSAGVPLDTPVFIQSRTISRDWRASMIVAVEDAVTMVKAMGSYNGVVFCGIPTGHVQITSMRSAITRKNGKNGSGLVRCHLGLRETEFRQDGVEVLDYRCKKTLWRQQARLVNFYDIFRGGHAVVSVGGKETSGS
jgi:hypothetical protein